MILEPTMNRDETKNQKQHTVATAKNSDKLDMTAYFPFLGTGIGTSIKRGEIKLKRFELK